MKLFTVQVYRRTDKPQKSYAIGVENGIISWAGRAMSVYRGMPFAELPRPGLTITPFKVGT